MSKNSHLWVLWGVACWGNFVVLKAGATADNKKSCEPDGAEA